MEKQQRIAKRHTKESRITLSNKKYQERTCLQRTEVQPGPSKIIQIKEPTEKSNSPEDCETGSTSSNDSIHVPPIHFKRYLGATGVQYIQLGRASYIHPSRQNMGFERNNQTSGAKVHKGFKNNRHGNN